MIPNIARYFWGKPQNSTITMGVASPWLMAISLLVSSFIQSPKKPFWNDELYSYYLLSDQSFVHMMSAFYDTINTNPPLYFMIGWIWAHVFGASPISLRLLSSLGLSVSILILWSAMRRAYGPVIASVSLLSVFSSATIILDQNVEARMYGVFVLLGACLILQFVRFNRPNHLSNKSDNFWAFITHAAIVNVHLFGIFYSIAYALSQYRLRYIRGQKNLAPNYIPIIAAWGTLVLYVPAFANQVKAGSERSWIPPAYGTDLAEVFIALSPSLTVVLGAAATAFAFSLSYKQKVVESKEARQELLLIGCGFLAVVPAVFSLSLIYPLFVDRYLIPSVLGMAILIAASLSFLYQKTSHLRSGNAINLGAVVVAVFVMLCIINPVKSAMDAHNAATPGSSDEIYGYEHLPVVVVFSHQFLPRLYYKSDSDRYFFVLDWSSATSPDSGRFSPQEHRHMQAFRRQYPAIFRNVVDSKSFLDSASEFLIVAPTDYLRKCPAENQKISRFDDLHCSQWVSNRLVSDGNYNISPIGTLPDGVLLHIEKASP